MRGFAGVEVERGGVAVARCSALGRGKAAARDWGGGGVE